MMGGLSLIPSEALGRPRIYVVVQTSGQLRDLAASRLFLINRAVRMAAEAADDQYDNQVLAGVEESERYLIDKGVSPKQAREMSQYRVFGVTVFASPRPPAPCRRPADCP